MSVDTDLATLRRWAKGLTVTTPASEALARVEAELSRLREQLHMAKASRDDWERQAKGRGVVQYELLARAEAAEARCARLQQALDFIAEKIELGDYGAALSRALAGPDTPADSQPEEAA